MDVVLLGLLHSRRNRLELLRIASSHGAAHTFTFLHRKTLYRASKLRY